MHDHRERAAATRRRPRQARWRDADDDTLLGWARDGDEHAFAELYQRHARAAHDYARRLSMRHLHRDAADDLVAEAMRKILEAISGGSGPVQEFRRYLFTAVRSVAYTQSRLARTSPLDGSEDTGVDPVDGWLEALVAIDAFNDLPRRWQEVLWATSVLGYTPTDLAPAAGLSANNVAVLSRRARDGLRTAYARQYLPRGRSRSCGVVLDALARSIVDRERGGRAHAGLVRRHLDRCVHCSTAAARLRDDLARPNRADDRAEATAG
jgi:RNA polymerase sigma factor (sigma-70 family)